MSAKAGFWKKAFNFVANQKLDTDATAEGIKHVAEKLGGKAMDGKGIMSALFEKRDMTKATDMFDFAIPYKVKGSIQTAAVVGALGIAATSGGMQVRQRNKLGEISASPLANQVNQTLSPGVQDDDKLQETAAKKSGNLNTRGAEGDIVFSLHNLR